MLISLMASERKTVVIIYLCIHNGRFHLAYFICATRGYKILTLFY